MKYNEIARHDCEKQVITAALKSRCLVLSAWLSRGVECLAGLGAMLLSLFSCYWVSQNYGRKKKVTKYAQ